MAPAPSLPKIELKLDHPARLYAPGDTITGTLTGWDPSRDSPLLHIILEGRSKSYIRLKGNFTFNYKDRTPLLYEYTQVKRADYNPTTQETRFTITIPKNVADDLSGVAQLTTARDYWTHSWTELAGFEHRGGYPLPPSMGMPRKHITQVSQTIYGWGYVRYTVTAVRSTVDAHLAAKRRLRVTGSSQKPVYITTNRMSIDEAEQFKQRSPTICGGVLCVATKRLDPTIGDRKLSFRESLKGTFSSSPVLRFKPVFTIPTTAVVGGNIKLSIRLEVPPSFQRLDGKRVPDMVLPPITLQSVTMRLKDSMGVRCKGSAVTKNYHYHFGDDDPIQGSWSPMHVFQPTADGKGYGVGCELDFAVPTKCVPTFRTCNFNKSWYVKGEAHFQCVGKRTEATFKGALELFSKPRRRAVAGVDGGDDAIVPVGAVEDDYDDEQDVLEMAVTMLDGLNAGLEVAGILGDLLDS